GACSCGSAGGSGGGATTSSATGASSSNGSSATNAASSSAMASSGAGAGGSGGGCNLHCGPTELCDQDHLRVDDNCNGQVDEGCGCAPGQAHACFKGDPAYHHAPGCFDGTEVCDAAGTWGPCTGGVHATDGCYAIGTTGCHAIASQPFVAATLKDGTGSF